MPIRQLTTHAWLLQKVSLANDDVLLVFLSQDLGKIKVFASKLQRSKKKQQELDYFRWLELGLSQPKQSYKLTAVKTLNDYSTALSGYERMQFSFAALEALSQFCPEEKAYPEMVQLLHEVLTLKTLPLVVVAVYFYTKLLWFGGVLPRFDTVRSEVWVDPINLQVTKQKQTEGIVLSNQQRQILEWIRRCHATELIEKHEKFPHHDLYILQAFLAMVIKNH